MFGIKWVFVGNVDVVCELFFIGVEFIEIDGKSFFVCFYYDYYICFNVYFVNCFFMFLFYMILRCVLFYFLLLIICSIIF